MEQETINILQYSFMILALLLIVICIVGIGDIDKKHQKLFKVVKNVIDTTKILNELNLELSKELQSTQKCLIQIIDSNIERQSKEEIKH